MEMCQLQNRCRTVVTGTVPDEAGQTGEWKTKDNWARGEVHLCCEADVQGIITDSEHAHEQWALLQADTIRKAD